MGIAVIMQKTPNKLPVISTAVAPQKVFWRDKVRQQASISQLETAGVQYRTGLKTNLKVSIVTCAWRGCVCVCVCVCMYACVHVCMCVDAVFVCRVQPWVPWLVLWRTATVSSMTWTPRWEAWSHPCTKPWRTWFLLWMQMLLPFTGFSGDMASHWIHVWYRAKGGHNPSYDWTDESDKMADDTSMS